MPLKFYIATRFKITTWIIDLVFIIKILKHINEICQYWMKKRSLLFPDFPCAFLLTVLFRINSAETVVDGDIFRFISSRRNSLFCQICPLTSQAKIAETIQIECRVEAYEWLATIYQPRTPHSKSIPWGPKQTNPSNFSVYMGLKALSRELAAHAR